MNEQRIGNGQGKKGWGVELIDELLSSYFSTGIPWFYDGIGAA